MGRTRPAEKEREKGESFCAPAAEVVLPSFFLVERLMMQMGLLQDDAAVARLDVSWAAVSSACLHGDLPLLFVCL